MSNEEQIAVGTDQPRKGKIPVIEIFGPVIQGEGAMIGHWTSFVRTGGCDFRCSHCDSLHAVDPAQVKQNSTWMTPDEIADTIIHNKLPKLGMAPWVTLSGGNPAMWDFSKFLYRMKMLSYKVAIETQGSLWKDWIGDCDQITISPKPHGMGDQTVRAQFDAFMANLFDHLSSLCGTCHNPFDKACIKIPVFGERDLDFAEEMVRNYGSEIKIYLSLGNPFPPEKAAAAGVTKEKLAATLLEHYARCSDAIAERPALVNNAIFLPQLHVLVYGNERLK